MAYQPHRPPRSVITNIRGLRYHVRIWGNAPAPKLVLLHGWMDVSASWQFMVDALAGNWQVIAPDWRGFGRSAWDPHGYWFPDYHADLDALLDEFAPAEAVHLIGHSMGGNVACIYAGVRPARVRKLVSLEGFGLPPVRVDDAPKRLAQWLDDLREPPALKPYASIAELAQRLQANNPRLDADKAQFLAAQHAVERDGQIEFSSDPRHKLPNPIPYRLEEARAAWSLVSAPTLWVVGDDSDLVKRFYGGDGVELNARAACFANIRIDTIADAGHMLHHDQPVRVAATLEAFLAD